MSSIMLVIQVDIGGHPPIPTGSKQFFGNLLFLAVFRVPNFRGHFGGLNNVCSWSGTSMILKGSHWAPKINPLVETFPTSYHAPQIKTICQSYAPRKLIHETTQNGVHTNVGFSFSGLGFWILFMLKRNLESHCNIIFLRMSISITSLLRDKIPPF